MFDIIAPYDDKLTLSIKPENIHHAQPRRPPPPCARGAQTMGEDETIEPVGHRQKDKQNNRAHQNLQRAAVGGNETA